MIAKHTPLHGALRRTRARISMTSGIGGNSEIDMHLRVLTQRMNASEAESRDNLNTNDRLADVDTRMQEIERSCQVFYQIRQSLPSRAEVNSELSVVANGLESWSKRATTDISSVRMLMRTLHMGLDALQTEQKTAVRSMSWRSIR